LLSGSLFYQGLWPCSTPHRIQHFLTSSEDSVTAYFQVRNPVAVKKLDIHSLAGKLAKREFGGRIC